MQSNGSKMTLFRKNKILKAHKSQTQRLQNLKKNELLKNPITQNTSFFFTTMALTACNGSNSNPNQTKPCQDFDSSEGYICLDNEISEGT